MTNAFAKFESNIASAAILERIYEYLSKKTLPFEPDELLRAEYVMVVSAFDCYVHDYVRERMVNAFKKPSLMADKTREYKVPLGIMIDIMNESNPISQIQLLENAIKKAESAYSYQSSSSVEHVLCLVGFKKIWTAMYGSPCGGTKKKQLDIIVRRRNQIAHEADMNYVTNTKNTISLSDVVDAKAFLVDLSQHIDSLT